MKSKEKRRKPVGNPNLAESVWFTSVNAVKVYDIQNDRKTAGWTTDLNRQLKEIC